MAFVVAPVVSELLGSLGLFAGEALAEVGVSEVAASTISKGLIGLAAGEIGYQTEEKITEAIGREKVEGAKNTVNDILSDAIAVLSKDDAYFINKKHEKIKKQLDFSKDDPSKFHGSATMYHYGETEKSKNIQAGEIKKISPKEVANFVVSYANELTDQVASGGKIDKIAAIEKVSNGNKETIELLTPFLKSRVPQTELYKKISETYNGDGLSIQNSITMYKDPIKNLLYFILKDEVGKLSTLYQTTGIVLPAYPGTVFMGPRSPNNNYPTGIVDLFCAFHDQDYSNGPSLEGDYKLISRCAQQYSFMDEQNQKLAKICIVYFGTLGTVVSNLFGSGPKDMASNISNIVVSDDIFSAIEPLKSTEKPIEHYNERTKFYSELLDEIDNLSKTSSIIAVNGSSYSNKLLAREFGDIIVQIN